MHQLYNLPLFLLALICLPRTSGLSFLLARISRTTYLTVGVDFQTTEPLVALPDEACKTTLELGIWEAFLQNGRSSHKELGWLIVDPSTQSGWVGTCANCNPHRRSTP